VSHFVSRGFSRSGLVPAETIAWLPYPYLLVSFGFVTAEIRASQGAWIAVLTSALLQEKLGNLHGFSLQP